MIDPHDVEQGIRLTAIAFGTAFGLLVFLMLVIMALGYSVRRVLRRKSSPSDEPGPDARGRALAAATPKQKPSSERRQPSSAATWVASVRMKPSPPRENTPTVRLEFMSGRSRPVALPR